MMIGGYVIVELPHGITASNGSVTPITVTKETVEKLRQFEKPVLIAHTEMTVDGSSVGIEGFTFHTRMAGVHQHYCGTFTISVTGDTQITINVL